MTILTKSFATAMAATLLGTGTLSAHHSFSLFDQMKEQTIEGSVKEFQWTNPHCWVQLLVKDSTGKEVEWSVEGGSLNVLKRGGWNRNSLKPGDKVSIRIHPLRDGGPGGSLMRVYLNGQPIGNSGPGGNG
jgi:hypothetical protein